MDGARRAGTRGTEVRLLGPVGLLVTAGRPPWAAPSRARYSQCSPSTSAESSPSTASWRLWPGDAPRRLPTRSKVYVSQLRKALGPVIATRPPGYVPSSIPSASTSTSSRASRRTAAPRSRPTHQNRGGGVARGAGPLARPGARGLPVRALRAGPRSPGSRELHGRARGADRGRPRARASRRARVRARGAHAGAAAQGAASCPA